MKIFALFVLGIIAAMSFLLLAAPARGACDPSYPTVCIAPPLPDLDCKDISARRFSVTGNDPHGFDSDGDGIGCE
jgi:micrococcal nuclease